MAEKKRIVVVGAGGHAKVVMECVDLERYTIVGILDKDNSRNGEYINNSLVIGSDSDIEKYKNLGIYGCIIAIGHVGNPRLRNRLFDLYRRNGFKLINAIHGCSYVSKSVRLGEGVVIMPHAVINSGTEIGDNVIINTSSVVEHDVKIASGVHIAPGSIVLGGVTVQSDVLIGAGATVIQGIKIGAGAIVGAGAVVINDVPPGAVVVGNPARVIKEV